MDLNKDKIIEHIIHHNSNLSTETKKNILKLVVIDNQQQFASKGAPSGTVVDLEKLNNNILLNIKDLIDKEHGL